MKMVTNGSPHPLAAGIKVGTCARQVDRVSGQLMLLLRSQFEALKRDLSSKNKQDWQLIIQQGKLERLKKCISLYHCMR
ncbi:hypothetical protein P692DRAFT_20765145 [Suillus brevipes Sb2]|nr:hypothetical protein P692DRAFT_20765145 [Suillus brevipes Sb2]